MIGCLIGLLVAVIVVLFVLWIVEVLIGAFGVTPPPPIMMLLRVLGALLVLLYALQCLGLVNDVPMRWGPR